MLVLSRRTNEDVLIFAGTDVIRVTVSSILGDKVRLGFIAPDHVRIDRDEIATKRAEGGAA